MTSKNNAFSSIKKKPFFKFQEIHPSLQRNPASRKKDRTTNSKHCIYQVFGKVYGLVV